MTEQEALCLVDALLQSANQGQRLNNLQSLVLRETWTGCSYREIAKQLGYEHDYIKQVGSRLWRSLSPQVGEKVSKRNVQAVLRRYQQSQTSRGNAPVPAALPSCLTCIQNWGEQIYIREILSVLADAEVTAENLPKEPLRQLLEALKSLKERSLI